MSRRAARPLLLAALLLTAWLLCHAAFAELDVVWLSLVPVFALVLPLVAGRYLGERTLARLGASRRPVRRRTAGPPLAVRRRLAAHHGHGGLLLARRLAGRAPPRALVAA
ncbi:MAG TPA: hypothetical protein VI318_06080 [Baekduia sp.]